VSARFKVNTSRATSEKGLPSGNLSMVLQSSVDLHLVLPDTNRSFTQAASHPPLFMAKTTNVPMWSGQKINTSKVTSAPKCDHWATRSHSFEVVRNQLNRYKSADLGNVMRVVFDIVWLSKPFLMLWKCKPRDFKLQTSFFLEQSESLVRRPLIKYDWSFWFVSKKYIYIYLAEAIN
jgi:hypothetical protein